MQTARHEWRRRTTAAALKQQMAAWLEAALPEGWSCQLLAAEGTAVADLLVISPRGRCHFLFVRAPADRWWDGGPRSVAAEPFSESDLRLARRLRAAGHRARAVRSAKDLQRALEAWGCPARLPRRPVAPVAGSPAGHRSPRPARPTLRLNAWRGRADA
jgi:hypothetical protein